MRKQLIVLGILLHFAAPAPAQVSFSFGFQTDNVSISLSSYPNLVRVPGYPVYYASDMNSNYFFYDGMYWVFETDRWYSSTWYNGPWMRVDPEFIPLYLLRVPVRYYRSPPTYFVGWQANSPPRWGDHWGNDWAQRRRGWDHWNRHSMPAPAPLPTYQRKYSGDRYPSQDRQHVLQSRNYRHDARDPLVRQQSEASRPSRNEREAVQRDRAQAPDRRNAEPAAAFPSPSPTVRQYAPDAPPTRPARDRPEPQRQQQTVSGMEERQAPPTQQQREPDRQNMRPQAESRQQHAQPRPDDRSDSRPENPGQHSGQQRERDNADERGHGRGR